MHGVRKHERVQLMAPLVFLDFDGVICTQGSYRRYSEYRRKVAYSEKNPAHVWHHDSADMIDPVLLANVGKLCAESGADVVISSSWRNLFEWDVLVPMLRRRGFEAPIIGLTPNVSSNGARGGEILEWLIEKRDWPRQTRGPWPEQPIVVLEDAEDIRPLRRFQVMTKFEGPNAGFTSRHLKAALRVLRGARDRAAGTLPKTMPAIPAGGKR